MKTKALAIMASMGAFAAVPAHAAFDYTALTAAVNEEVTAASAFAYATLALVMGALIGLKLAKTFVNKAT